MMNFLRQNWPYVVLPAVVVLAVIVWLLTSGGGSESPFSYPIF